MKHCIFFIINLLWSCPAYAFGAATLDTSTFSPDVGSNVTVGSMVDSVVSTLTATVIPVAVAVFTIGAGLYVISGEKEDRKNQGKEFMIGALIGVAIVTAAKAILNLTLYFIYGS